MRLILMQRLLLTPWAARSVSRLNTTIQLTDTGISPGSGVGNHRHGLNRESLGIPVVAIGIPTVIDAATIVNDTMNSLMEALEQRGVYQDVYDAVRSFDHQEKIFAHEGIDGAGSGQYVCYTQRY